MSNLLEKAKSLPDTPGAYLFYSQTGELIYVGKATSLKNRVKSYFQGMQTPRPIEEMIHEVVSIDFRQTDSVLEAVILEANLIKKHLPKYNVLGKDSKSWNYLGITKESYPRLESIRAHDLKMLKNSGVDPKKKFSHLFGPYPSLNTRATMKILRRIFNFSVCKPGASRPCIYYEMGQCLGVCIGEITPADYRKRVIHPLSWFLSGKKKAVIEEFERDMKKAAREEKFEEAAHLRNQIAELQHIHDVTLIDKSFFEDEDTGVGMPVNRIEGYDISNLGSTGVVGSMVVFEHGAPHKSDYRKFIIRSFTGQSDVDALAEVINRRLNHPEWPLPDVILLDGGRPQISRIKKVFSERGVEIPFLGIAKGAQRKRNDIILGDTVPAFVHWASKHRGLLVRVRDEAHRFAITFQRSKRKIK